MHKIKNLNQISASQKLVYYYILSFFKMRFHEFFTLGLHGSRRPGYVRFLNLKFHVCCSVVASFDKENKMFPRLSLL